MLRIRLSNLLHSVGAAKLKDLSKNVLEQFLLSGGITNNKSSLAERVFVELLFFSLIQTNTWERLVNKSFKSSNKNFVNNPLFNPYPN